LDKIKLGGEQIFHHILKARLLLLNC